MSSGSIARRYAKAIVQLGDAHSVLERVSTELSQLAGWFSSSPELATTMSNPAFPREERRQVVLGLVTKLQAHDVTKHTLLLLLDKDRLGDLSGIAREVAAMVQARSGKVDAEIASHGPLSAEQLAAITSSLERLTGKKLAVQLRQDPTLLGGVVAKVGDLVFDGSVRSALRRMRDDMALERGE